MYTINDFPLCLTVRLLEEPQSIILRSDSVRTKNEDECLTNTKLKKITLFAFPKLKFRKSPKNMLPILKTKHLK